MASGHEKRVCEFGRTHGQCRCNNTNKLVVKIHCDVPNLHAPGLVEDYQPKHKKE